MRNVIISNGQISVELMPETDFRMYYEEVSKQATMASGKIVKDKIGVRPVLDIPVGYLPLSDVQNLKNMINSGSALTVSYPAVGGDESHQFYVSQPRYHGVKYDDAGVSIWLGMSITCRGVEVIR